MAGETKIPRFAWDDKNALDDKNAWDVKNVRDDKDW
jgi:hypothetical protein